MKRLLLISSLLLGSSLIAAPGAGAVVTIGPNPLPPRSLVLSGGPASTVVNSAVPGATLASPFDGVVVRWRTQRTDGPGGMPADTVALRVLHPTGTSGELLGAGTSDSHSLPADTDPIGVREFTTRLPIRAGDLVGYDTTSDFVPAGASGGAAFLSANAVPDDQTETFSTLNGEYVLINADVDPELTSITAAPKAKVKTKKKRVRVNFAFSSNAPGVGFSCSLDGAAPSVCTSPASFRVRRGSHSFQVQATYKGAPFGSPASDGFRVKRRRK
jgi:hypothetical protein